MRGTAREGSSFFGASGKRMGRDKRTRENFCGKDIQFNLISELQLNIPSIKSALQSLYKVYSLKNN